VGSTSVRLFDDPDEGTVVVIDVRRRMEWMTGLPAVTSLWGGWGRWRTQARGGIDDDVEGVKDVEVPTPEERGEDGPQLRVGCRSSMGPMGVAIDLWQPSGCRPWRVVPIRCAVTE
jgi:hypothetical protein